MNRRTPWIRSRLAAALLALAAFPAFAGDNVAPFDLEVGTATLTQVQAGVGTRTPLAENGRSVHAGGPALEGDGRGLGIEGLQRIEFFFDSGSRLQAVMLALNKGGIDQGGLRRVIATLSAKYKTEAQRIPAVGDAYARFRRGASIVEVNSPHPSLQFNVTYLTDDLVKRVRAAEEAAAADRRRRERSAF